MSNVTEISGPDIPEQPKAAIHPAPHSGQEQDDNTAQPDAQAELDKKTEEEAKKADENKVHEAFGAHMPDFPNAACLASLAQLWEVNDIPLFDYLQNLETIRATPDLLHLAGTDNRYYIGKKFIEAQKPSISARTAFEMGILAMGNPDLQKQGVEITGSLADRYLLTLSAAHMGLKVTNPVRDEDISPDLAESFAAKKAEWLAVLKDPHHQVKAALTVPEPAATDEDANIVSGAVTGIDDADQNKESFLTPSDKDIYPRAVQFVADEPISNASLQRGLSIGYNRAARLLNEMEKDGIISPKNHNKRRTLLTHPEQKALQP